MLNAAVNQVGQGRGQECFPGSEGKGQRENWDVLTDGKTRARCFHPACTNQQQLLGLVERWRGGGSPRGVWGNVSIFWRQRLEAANEPSSDSRWVEGMFPSSSELGPQGCDTALSPSHQPSAAVLQWCFFLNLLFVKATTGTTS